MARVTVCNEDGYMYDTLPLYHLEKIDLRFRCILLTLEPISRSLHTLVDKSVLREKTSDHQQLDPNCAKRRMNIKTTTKPFN